MSLNSSGLTPTTASTAVSAKSGVWLRRVLLAVAAIETLIGLIDLAVFVPDIDINARLFIHPFFAIAALVLAARRYLRAAIVVLAAYILAALAIGWSLDFALGGLSLLAQQVIFGPLAVAAIVLAILDKHFVVGRGFRRVAVGKPALGHDSPDSVYNRGHNFREGSPLTGGGKRRAVTNHISAASRQGAWLLNRHLKSREVTHSTKMHIENTTTISPATICGAFSRKVAHASVAVIVSS